MLIYALKYAVYIIFIFAQKNTMTISANSVILIARIICIYNEVHYASINTANPQLHIEDTPQL